MPRPPLTTSYWPADTCASILDTTIGGVLRAAAERAPYQPALVAGDPDPARRRQWSYGQRLPEAERAASEVLALPIHPALTQSEGERVVSEIGSFLRGETS